MPYRDPAQKAAWMRKYRKRKRLGKTGALGSSPTAPSGVRAPEPLSVSPKTIDSSGRQPAPANTGVTRNSVRSSFKTALQLARTFPFGVLASQVCRYCYNTGYSSPDTRCSYCQGAKK
jgi:hypothetical protein